MENEFQTLRIIPESVENASRFGPGFAVGSDRGRVVRDEFVLLRRVAALAAGFTSDNAIGPSDAQALINRVDALHGKSPEDLIASLQNAGDKLLDAIMNGADISVTKAAYLDTAVSLFALMR
jgi:hypothetical protein